MLMMEWGVARCVASGTVLMDPQTFGDILAIAQGHMPSQASMTPTPGARIDDPLAAAAQISTDYPAPSPTSPMPSSSNGSSPLPGGSMGGNGVGPPVASTAPGVQLAEELSKEVPSQTSVPGSGAAQAGGDVAGEAPPQLAQDATGVQFEEIFPDAQWHQEGISEDNIHQPAAPSSAAQVAYPLALWLLMACSLMLTVDAVLKSDSSGKWPAACLYEITRKLGRKDSFGSSFSGTGCKEVGTWKLRDKKDGS